VDLLVSDVIVPGGNGTLVAEGLRHRWPDLRVLHVSGYAQDGLSELVPALGIEFLQKPFDASSLLARITRVLGPG
jgi:DNA-binding NtrC family response regulator